MVIYGVRMMLGATLPIYSLPNLRNDRLKAVGRKLGRKDFFQCESA
jgi:hypothetical protein